MRVTLSTHHFLSLILALSACSAQTGPHYQGEPLATLHGSIVTQGNPPPEGAQIAILYDNHALGYGRPYRQSLGITLPYRSSHLAGFDLPIYEPPPPEAFFAPPEGLQATRDQLRRTVASIVVLGPNTDPLNIREQDILGVSLSHQLIFFSGVTESASEFFFGEGWGEYRFQYQGPLEDGFHPLKIYPLSLPERAAERQDYHECQWLPGLCVLNVHSDDYVSDGFSRWNFDECMKQSPVPDSCTIYNGSDQNAEKIRSTQECQQKMRVINPNGFPFNSNHPCPDAPITQANVLGFDDLITITMGASLVDAAIQVN